MKYRWLRTLGWTVLLLLVMLVYSLYYHTSLYWEQLQGILNRSLAATTNVTLQADLEGNIASGRLVFSDLSLQMGDTLVVFAADTLVVHADLQALFEEDARIDSLVLGSLEISQKGLQDLKFRGGRRGSTPRNYLIDYVHVDSSTLVLADPIASRHSISMMDMEGTFWSLDGYRALDIVQGTLRLPLDPSQDLELEGSFQIDPSGSLQVDGLTLGGTAGELVAELSLRDSLMTANVVLRNVVPGRWVQSDQSLAFLDWPLSGKLEIVHPQSSAWVVAGRGKWGTVDHWDLTELNWQNGILDAALDLGPSGQLGRLKVAMDSTRELAMDVQLDSFPLGNWLPDDLAFILSASGELQAHTQEDRWSLVADLHDVQMPGLLVDTLALDLSPRAIGEGSVFHSRLQQGKNHLTLRGDLQEDRVSVTGKAALTDFTLLPGWRQDSLAQGRIDMNFAVHGAVRTPELTGDISLKDFGWGTQLRLNALGKFEFAWDGRSHPTGQLVIRGDQGLFNHDSLDRFALSAHVDGPAWGIDELHIQGQNNLFRGAWQSTPRRRTLDRLILQLGAHRLELVQALPIHREDQDWVLGNSVFSFDKSAFGLQGRIRENIGPDLDLAFELVDLADLLEFLAIPARETGIASGHTRIQRENEQLVFHTVAKVQSGEIIGYRADSLRGSFSVAGDNILADSILIYRGAGIARLRGRLPYGYNVRGDAWRDYPQNFTLRLQNYDIHDLRFKTIVGQEVGGHASGRLSFRGTPVDTRLDGLLDFQDIQFDTLQFTSGHAAFEYTDNLLTFDSLSALATWGYGQGSGYLPLVLDIGARDRPALNQNMVGMEFQGDFSELPFLSSYIDPIDEIKGDFTMELAIDGPLGAPLRNGKLRGHNAWVVNALTGVPLTNIHTELTLVDNTMTLDHFSGRMPFAGARGIGPGGMVDLATGMLSKLVGIQTGQEYSGDLTATGDIDFSSFFHPRFNLRLRGDEVYYRSTDGSVEALSNADLTFTGQDTLTVAGELPVLQAGYFGEFSSGPSYEEQVTEQNTGGAFTYRLHALMPGNLIIENSLLQAEFEGDLYLLDYGDGELRFSGTLTALPDGKFFYLGNELRILEGSITFNSVDFNPQINFIAGIDIEGQEVELTLTGDLLEPQLILPQDANLNQSDILAYLTINQKVVEEGFDATRIVDPVESYVGILVEKQLERYGKQIIGLDIIDLRMEGSGNVINSFTNPQASTRLLLGQRVFKNLKLTYEGDLRSSDPVNNYDFGLEYQVNRNFSITSKVDQDGLFQLRGRLKYSY